MNTPVWVVDQSRGRRLTVDVDVVVDLDGDGDGDVAVGGYAQFRQMAAVERVSPC